MNDPDFRESESGPEEVAARLTKQIFDPAFDKLRQALQETVDLGLYDLEGAQPLNKVAYSRGFINAWIDVAKEIEFDEDPKRREEFTSGIIIRLDLLNSLISELDGITLDSAILSYYENAITHEVQALNEQFYTLFNFLKTGSSGVIATDEIDKLTTQSYNIGYVFGAIQATSILSQNVLQEFSQLMLSRFYEIILPGNGAS